LGLVVHDQVSHDTLSLFVLSDSSPDALAIWYSSYIAGMMDLVLVHYLVSWIMSFVCYNRYT